MLDNENCESEEHYFIFLQANVKGKVQFCERMGINYIKRNVF